MGLKYGVGESAALMSALHANLSEAKSMLVATGTACDRLTGSLGGSELSGKGYLAAKALFSGLLKPGVLDMQIAVEALQEDVEAYSRADSLVSQYGDLDEDRLQAQVVLVRVQRDATEQMIHTNQLLAAGAVAVPGLSYALDAANSRLEMLLSGFEDDLRELDDKLRALAAFDGQTSGLFTESLAALARSSRKVTAAVKSGGGTGFGVASVVLKTGKSETQKKVERLLEDGLSPAQVAARWKASGLTPEMLKSLTPEMWLKLASLSGLPAEAQDSASRKLLNWALKAKNADEAYALFGFTEDWYVEGYGWAAHLENKSTDIEKAEFSKQLASMKQALDEADKDAKTLDGKPVVQLVGLGNHDGVPVAGISFGNLDTASNLGVNVSGMGSNVGDMFSGNSAARTLYADAYNKNDSASYAVVNWVGYRPPVIADGKVWGMERAESGGKRFTSFLEGINASRTSLRSDTNPYPTQFNVYAHSYGSTTAFEALKNTSFSVSLVATYGSAGVKNGTTRDEIQADKVYATKAPGVFADGLDNIGRTAGPKTLDPIGIPGVVPFSSNDSVNIDGDPTKRTTVHDMFREEDSSGLVNWGGATGYMSPDATSLDRMGTMLATGSAK